MSKDRILGNTFYAHLFSYICSSLASTAGNVVDGIIIGQYMGVDSIAAFGIVNPIIVFFAVFSAVIEYGSRGRCVRLISSGKVKDAQGIFSLACILSVGIGTVAALIILAFAMPITRILGATGNAASLLPEAGAYLTGITLGLPFQCMMRVLWTYMAVDNDRDLPTAAAVATTVTDILLDLYVVFVIHGGIFEIGLATSLSYVAAVIVLLTHFRKKNIFLRFSFRGVPWREAGDIIRQGLPVGINRVGNTLRRAFMNNMLAVVAAAAVAAYSVHLQAYSLFNCVTIGMADSVAVIAGVLTGEENRPMLKRLFHTSMRATLFLTTGIAALIFLFAAQFAGLFIKEDLQALPLSVRAVRAYAVGMPLYGLNLIYFNYLQGTGRGRLASASGLLSSVLLPILSAMALFPGFGADAVWFAFPAGEVLLMVYYAAVIAVQSRRLGIRSGGLWGRILLLPDSFDVPDEDRMDLSITTMDEVAALSRRVWDFCEDHGCDARRKYFMSLAVEEMAGNVILHGFNKDKKKHSVDVRILSKGRDFILRIRDDCPVFDPLKQMTLYSDEDISHHIGLRMIFKTAQDIQYTHILKLNNLVVKI